MAGSSSWSPRRTRSSTSSWCSRSLPTICFVERQASETAPAISYGGHRRLFLIFFIHPPLRLLDNPRRLARREAAMDLDRVIERNTGALKRIVAMAGLGASFASPLRGGRREASGGGHVTSDISTWRSDDRRPPHKGGGRPRPPFSRSASRRQASKMPAICTAMSRRNPPDNSSHLGYAAKKICRKSIHPPFGLRHDARRKGRR